jgi:hypothetical protein
VNRLKVKEIDRDRHLRIAEGVMGSRTILFPSYSPLIKTADSPNELSIVASTKKRYPLQHTDTMVVRVFDSQRIIGSQFDKERNLTLDGIPVQSHLSAYGGRDMVIPDPATEYLFFEDYYTRFMGKTMPKVIRNYASMCNAKKKSQTTAEFNQTKKKLHSQFWMDLSADLKELNKMIGEFMDIEQKYYDYQVHPSPLITDEDLFETSTEVNRLSRAISEARDRECATYLLFHSDVLHDLSLLEKALEYMEKNDNTLTILKFKNLDLTTLKDFEGRENYKNILARLVDIKNSNQDRAFMLLEAGNQFWVSWQAFDCVSSSLTGIDSDVHFGKNHFGLWWDPTELVPRNHSDFVRKYNNEGTGFGMHCPACSSIIGGLPDSKEYHVYRREHRLHDMDQKADTISRAISERTTEVVFGKVLQNSSLANLHNILLG